jgi:hypothetical protein
MGEILKRTFEAARHPKGSPERARLNEETLTSEYMTSMLWLATVEVTEPSLIEGERTVTYTRRETFRTKQQAQSWVDAKERNG